MKSQFYKLHFLWLENSLQHEQKLLFFYKIPLFFLTIYQYSRPNIQLMQLSAVVFLFKKLMLIHWFLPRFDSSINKLAPTKYSNTVNLKTLPVKRHQALVSIFQKLLNSQKNQPVKKQCNFTKLSFLFESLCKNVKKVKLPPQRPADHNIVIKFDIFKKKLLKTNRAKKNFLPVRINKKTKNEKL